ncbi:hypothetical protein K3495_g16037, partial [Podosphaera aphanis]
MLHGSAENIIQTLELDDWKVQDVENSPIETIISIPLNPSDKAKKEPASLSPGSSKISKQDITDYLGHNSENYTAIEKEKARDLSKEINSNIDIGNIVHGKRRRKPVNFAVFHNSFSAASTTIAPTKIHRNNLPPPPKNHREVLLHEFSAGFKAAEQKEFNTLLDKKLFSTISIQEVEFMKNEGKIDAAIKTLPLMWVYTYKFDADGFLKSFKARLVARGDLESTTEETYAATLAGQVFRTAMAISAAYGYKIRQYDIVAAYTNADLPQPRVAYLPDGFQ